MLERGAAHATAYMGAELSQNPKVRMINSAQMFGCCRRGLRRFFRHDHSPGEKGEL